MFYYDLPLLFLVLLVPHWLRLPIDFFSLIFIFYLIYSVSKWTKLAIVSLILTFSFIVKYSLNGFETHSLYHLSVIMLNNIRFVIMLNNMSSLNIINNFNRIIMSFRAETKSQYHRFIFVLSLIFNHNSLNPLICYRRSTTFYISSLIDYIPSGFFSSFSIIIIITFNIDYE